MPTVAAPADQSVEIVSIDNLARACFDNALDAEDIRAYLQGRNSDRDVSGFLALI